MRESLVEDFKEIVEAQFIPNYVASCGFQLLGIRNERGLFEMPYLCFDLSLSLLSCHEETETEVAIIL